MVVRYEIYELMHGAKCVFLQQRGSAVGVDSIDEVIVDD